MRLIRAGGARNTALDGSGAADPLGEPPGESAAALAVAGGDFHGHRVPSLFRALRPGMALLDRSNASARGRLVLGSKFEAPMAARSLVRLRCGSRIFLERFFLAHHGDRNGLDSGRRLHGLLFRALELVLRPPAAETTAGKTCRRP